MQPQNIDVLQIIVTMGLLYFCFGPSLHFPLSKMLRPKLSDHHLLRNNILYHR